MSSSIMFLLSVLGLVILVILFSFRGDIEEIKKYFGTKTGLGILKGIVLVVLLSVIVSAMGEERKGSWFDYGEFFAGLDYTNKISPQCYSNGPDDRTTSNVGFRFNIYKSADSKFHVNSKYTHHSCALNPDRESYDALGVEFIHRLW